MLYFSAICQLRGILPSIQALELAKLPEKPVNRLCLERKSTATFNIAKRLSKNDLFQIKTQKKNSHY
jgi:hypothetical protein